MVIEWEMIATAQKLTRRYYLLPVNDLGRSSTGWAQNIALRRNWDKILSRICFLQMALVVISPTYITIRQHPNAQYLANMALPQQCNHLETSWVDGQAAVLTQDTSLAISVCIFLRVETIKQTRLGGCTVVPASLLCTRCIVGRCIDLRWVRC